jgi:hypothetical protein
MNLTAKAGSGSVYLSWEPPEFSGVWGVDEYDILRKGGRETEWTYIGVVDGSLTHFNDTNEGFHNGPLSGTTYQYYITATIYYSESAPSNTVTATTSLISPDHVAIIIGIDYPRLTLGSGSIYTIGKYVPGNEPFQGTITLNDTVPKQAVGAYGYKVTSINDPKYGLANSLQMRSRSSMTR